MTGTGPTRAAEFQSRCEIEGRLRAVFVRRTEELPSMKRKDVHIGADMLVPNLQY